jgi:hypothetical protein
VRRFALFVVGLAGLWLVGLAVAGFLLAGRARDGVAQRLGEALNGRGSVGDGSLSLVRGAMQLDALAVRRDDLVGHLALDVASLRCELRPLGLALFDRDCQTLAIRGVRFSASTAGLLRLEHHAHAPLHAARLELDDARIELSPSALAPSIGRVSIAIAHADAGDTVFKTPLSFVFALRTLDATIEIAGMATLHVQYTAGILRLSGIGPVPLIIPLSLPARELADDAAAELAKLTAFGKSIAERLVAQRAIDWLKSKLLP